MVVVSHTARDAIDRLQSSESNLAIALEHQTLLRVKCGRAKTAPIMLSL
jgi:phage I-like protein